MDKQKQIYEEISLFKEIASKLEWSRIERKTDFETGRISRPFYVCPLCGGVKNHDYDLIDEIHNDNRFHRNHFNSCLFSRIDLSNF